VAGSCEHGHESSGSGAVKLVGPQKESAYFSASRRGNKEKWENFT
jgi:hypothetical protein